MTGKRQWSAMGSTANIAGRALALNLSGEETEYKGCLGTGVVKLMDGLNGARTGLTEAQAKAEGFHTVTVLCISDDKAHYYPGSSIFITKLIADGDSHRLLGMQVIGGGAVDKMADIAVTGISMGCKAEDFITMDFAYAPPFYGDSSLCRCCSILANKMSGRIESFTPVEYAAGAANGYRLIDAHPRPHYRARNGLTWPRQRRRWKNTEKTISYCSYVQGGKGGIWRRTSCVPLGLPIPACWKGVLLLM